MNQAKDSLSAVLRLRYGKDDAISSREDYIGDMLKKEYKSSKASDLQARIYHKQYVETEISALDRERRQLLEIETLRRNKLNSAMQDEKILLKLKEKKQEQHSHDVLLEENQFIDEIAVSRFRNKEQED